MGYNVLHTPLSGDQGADVIITRLNEKVVVQSKKYTSKVSNRAVQEVVASIAHYNANRGLVVTNSEYTSSAIELANSNSIEIINGEKLSELLTKYPVYKEDIKIN